MPLIGISSQTAGSLEDVMGIDDVNVQGIASDSSGAKVAIMNGEMVKEGETVGRVTVKKISKKEIVLSIDDVEYIIDISEEM